MYKLSKELESSSKKNLLKLKSFSKINLGLWIKEKRPDSYHNLETIFFENINLYDEVEIIFLENSTSVVKVNFIQEELNNLIVLENNLAYKAAMLFMNESNVCGECIVTVNKKIPLGAGLGGGSSNAACVLKGLNKIFNDRFEESKLLELGSRLGSDVSFFMKGKTCLGNGRGEILELLENKLKLQLKIVKPKELSVSTKWAYEQIDAREFEYDHREQIDNLIYAMKEEDYDLFFKNIFNDFEQVIFSCYPQLINERNKLLCEGYSSSGLCGSGSAIFGIKKLVSRQ